MLWKVDENKPIYPQLMEEIIKRIITGKYPIGERLPSVRDLAEEASVNPNTMQKAMMELEKLELVKTQRGIGRTVTEDKEKVLVMKKKIADEEIQSCINSLRALDYTVKEIESLISSYISESKEEV